MAALVALLAKIIIIIFIGVFCKPPAVIIVLFCAGIVVYSINEIFLIDSDSYAKKAIMHTVGSLLMLVPIIVITVPYLSLENDALNYMKTTALSLVSLFLTLNWANIGFMDEEAGTYELYLIAGGLLILNGVIYMVSLSLHTLLIINIIIAAIAVLVNVIMRLVMGSAFD